MALPGGNLTVWTDIENPSIIFHELPEPMPLMLGWPDAVGVEKTSQVEYVVLGDIQLVIAVQGTDTYKIEFVQYDANAYVIYNGIAGS